MAGFYPNPIDITEPIAEYSDYNGSDEVVVPSRPSIAHLPPMTSLFRKPASAVGIPAVPQPADWKPYFDYKAMMQVTPARTLCIYGRGAPPPASAAIVEGAAPAPVTGPVVVCLHGAGSCALSYALFAGALSREIPVLALDLPYHGDSAGEGDQPTPWQAKPPYDLSMNHIVECVTNFIDSLRVPVVLVGHSLGAAVAAKVATESDLVSGICALDLVESVAAESLVNMRDVLESRPSRFSCLRRALEWAQACRVPKNTESAIISIPRTLRFDRNNVEQSWEQPLVSRLDLTATEIYWSEWFKNFNSNFLNTKCRCRALMLANRDTMDADLLTGHMQGKFMLHIVKNTGHHVQEDAPLEIAQKLLDFMRHMRITADTASLDVREGVPSLPPLTLVSARK